MRVFMTFVLLLFTAASAAAAQEYAITVRAIHDGSAVMQANVTLGTQAQMTTPRGESAFRVTAGRYDLTVTALGFETVTASVTVSRDTTITIELEQDAFEAEEIIVTSTRGERRVQDEPVKVEVVTREEVEEKMLMTPGSISMLLNETSGLRVQEISPALGGAVVRIQGLRGRYTQLLSDGLPIYGGQAGSLGIMQIPPIDLAQVEVIKGAASALYGSSALGGAINLISRRPADGLEVMLNQTTRRGTDIVLWSSNQLRDDVGYTMLLSGHTQRSQDVDGDGWSDLPRYRRVVARPRLFLDGANGGRFMLTAGAMIEDRRGGGDVPDGTQYPQELETARYDAGATMRVPLRGMLHLDVRASGSRVNHRHVFGDVLERDAHTTAFAEASLRGQSGRHYWVAGAAIQTDAYVGDDVDTFDYTYLTPSAFVQDEIALTDRLTGSFSVRADHHSEYGAFIAPRASALMRVTDAASLRLSAGRGYFGPTPFTEETEEVGLSRVAIPASLRAERGDIVSADINWSAAPVEFNVSVFGSRVRDAVQTVESDDALELANIGGDTRTYGVETLARYRHEPFGVTASYTNVRATQPSLSGTREAVPLVPRHSASVVAVYEEHGSGRVGIECYYTGAQPLRDDPWRATSRPYLIVGVLIERRIGRVRAFVNMENLTNVRQTNYDPIVRPAQASGGRWTTDVWAPVDGRTFNAGVRIALR